MDLELSMRLWGKKPHKLSSNKFPRELCWGLLLWAEF